TSWSFRDASFRRNTAKETRYSKDLVMYCARHDFGTYALSHTGNLAAVMKTMGHKDVKTAMQYQHPEVEHVRDVINSRNARHNLRHKHGYEPAREKDHLMRHVVSTRVLEIHV